MQGVSPKETMPRLVRWWIRLTVAGCVAILCGCQHLAIRREPPSPALPQLLGRQEKTAGTALTQLSHANNPATVTPGEPGSFGSYQWWSPPPTGVAFSQSPRAVENSTNPYLPREVPGAAVPVAYQVPAAETRGVEADLRIEAAPVIPREGLVYPYQPPGARRPWPHDEYLRGGGDDSSTASVSEDWRIRGLEAGDTIVHYDTQAGKRVVEPTNPVYIYSPRFGAVRQVVTFLSDEQVEFLAGTQSTARAVQRDTQVGALANKQHYQLQERTADRRLNQIETKEGDGSVSGALVVRGLHDGFLPYENLGAIFTREVDARDFALLAQGAAAARGWSHAVVLQVFIDNKAAVAVPGTMGVDVIYTVEEPPTFPKLRVIKLASRAHAAPGEVVHFTIRFDNVGTEPLENVTIVDSLQSRLEFVAGTAECSLPSEFSFEENQAGSVVLRWQLTEPLQPGEGGIIRFQCRVR